MYRRQFLASSAALTASLAFGRASHAAEQPPGLTIGTRVLEVNGKAATVYGLTRQDGTSGLAFGPGEMFRIALENTLSEPTIVHWHGLIPPFEQDGVAANPLPMLASGEQRPYDFALDRPGTYWMHAHTLQHQNLLSAPLIVRSADDLAADMQEVVVLLHDFSFTPAEELLARLGTGGMDHGAMDHESMDMGSMDMGSMDLNDINYDAYLANDRTLDDPDVIAVERGGRVRLRIINGAASTAFTLATGALHAELVAVDGQPVVPVKAKNFPMSMGQRIDLLVSIPANGGAFPILAQREGAVERAGVILRTPDAAIGRLAPQSDRMGPVLDLALEQRLVAWAPLTVRKADREYTVHLTGDMATYRWGMMGAASLAANPGERVEISMMNMSMMAHPMHLHGHHFQIVAVDGQRFSGPVRDTVLVPPMKTVTISFDAGAKGRWPFHCHHLYHMESGMMAHMQVG